MIGSPFSALQALGAAAKLNLTHHEEHIDDGQGKPLIGPVVVVFVRSLTWWSHGCSSSTHARPHLEVCLEA
jgi:hypothetical protein